MAFPSVRFVDAPNEQAAVRLDVNGDNGNVRVDSLHDNFDLGMPTRTGAPGRRGARWGVRQLPLPLLIKGSRTQAIAVLTRLAREATRDGWLRWQLDAATSPVWFRVYASAPDPLSFQHIHRGTPTDWWKTKLNLAADPFGIGAPVVLGPYSISGDPLAGAAGMRVALPEILGEVPAPALVRVSKPTASPANGPAAAVLPHDLSVALVSSTGPGVIAPVADGRYVGGQRRMTSDQVTNAGWTSLAAFQPTTGMRPGRRRALLHVSGTADGGTFLLRWYASSPGGSTLVYSDPVPVRVHNDQLRWVDTGTLPYPFADAAALGVNPGTVYVLQARRAAPAGQLYIGDGVILLPTDDATLQAALPGEAVATAAEVLFDSEQRRVLMAAGATMLRSPATRGGWPTVRPGTTNVLWVAHNLDPVPVIGHNDVLTATADVTVTYRPRHLWGVG